MTLKILFLFSSHQTTNLNGGGGGIGGHAGLLLGPGILLPLGLGLLGNLGDLDGLGHPGGKLLGLLDVLLDLGVVSLVGLELLTAELLLGLLVAVQADLGPSVGNLVNFGHFGGSVLLRHAGIEGGAGSADGSGSCVKKKMVMGGRKKQGEMG